MFFFNLSAFEFLALFGAVSGLVVTLYLLSRSKRKQTVSTLHFWRNAQSPLATRQRRRIQQPVSLLLQLLGLLFLLLALAQLRLGSPSNSSRDHVLLLDTSSWMAARSGAGTLMDEAKAKAKAYIVALPSTDRVMVIRAEGVPIPATGLEVDRDAIYNAIDNSRPAAAALNLEHDIDFARQVLKLRSQNPGEIAFVGTSRTTESGAPSSAPLQDLRIIPVSDAGSNVGFTKVGLRRSPENPELWECFLSVRNYSSQLKSVPLVLQFGGAPVGSRLLPVEPGKVAETVLTFRTKAAGWLEARLMSEDVLAEDNRAFVELPLLQSLKLSVFSDDPEVLRSALAAFPNVSATFKPVAEYSSDHGGAAVILDRFSPAALPKVPSLWIYPPAERSPVRVTKEEKAARVTSWRSGHELAFGLNTTGFSLPATNIYALADGDEAIAETEQGPVLVVRPSTRAVVFGFDPGSEQLRNELATALLMANALRWLAPAVFAGNELYTASVGTITVPVPRATQTDGISVTGERQELPFTVGGGSLRFFSAGPDVVRVRMAGAEQVYSLSLPEVAPAIWTAPASVRRGVPRQMGGTFSRDIWQWLALAGAAILLIEWLLYGPGRRITSAGATVTSRPSARLRKAS